MVKLIVTDIDGTLVGDGQGEGALNPEYFQVIQSLLERGVRFMTCSGRQRLSMAKLFRPLADRIYFACDGGSDIYDKECLLFAKTLPHETVAALIEDAARIPLCDIMVCGTKRAYCRDAESELYHWMVDGYGYDMKVVPDLVNDIEDEIVKVSIYHRDRAEELTNPWFRPRWEDKVKLTLAGIQWLDCVPKDAGKGAAVAFMQHYFHILPSETVVFGDNQNDMEMFDCADRSYAVSNAREEVKKRAVFECGSYEEDGVLKVLKQILEANC